MIVKKPVYKGYFLRKLWRGRVFRDNADLTDVLYEPAPTASIKRGSRLKSGFGIKSENRFTFFVLLSSGGRKIDKF